MIIPLFGLDVSGGSPAKSLNVNAQERLNLYVEVRLDPDKTRMVLYPTPGLIDLLAMGNAPARGIYAVGDFLYVAQRTILYKVDNASTLTAIGTFATDTGFISMVDNGLQLFMVDGTNGYAYVFATGEFATMANGQNIVSNGAHNGLGTATFFPLKPRTCTFQGGAFIVNEGASGRFWIGALYDVFTWNASTNFATAETNPDNLVTVLADHGEVVMFGEVTTEFWGNTGAQSFPFSLIQGTSLEWGLAAPQAVAKFDNSLIFLGRNRQGQTQVVQLSGHNALRISTHELEARFEDYSGVGDATAFAYMLDGHPMFQLNFSSGGESWLYDGATSAAIGMPVWSQVQSAGLGRHRLDRVVVYLNRLVGADFSNGNLYRISHAEHTEAGEVITSRLRTRHHFEDNVPVSVAQLWLDVETGVGTELGMRDETGTADLSGQGADPNVVLRYSKDHGHTWSNELWRSLGKAGEFNKRCYWNRLGAARDWVFEWTITDPVKRVLLNAGLKTNSVKKRMPV